MTDLHVETFGSGVSAIFVHGSFGWGLDTFPEQRALADDYRVVLVDRRGFGGAAAAESDGWPTDMLDIAGLLDEVGEVHLVGHSYGGVVALLAAGLRPERVLSLVAIEPVAWEFGRGDPDVDPAVRSLNEVYERAGTLSTQQFVAEWGRARGRNEEQLAEWTQQFSDADWSAAEATRRERWPGDAPINVDVLRPATFPKVLARGAWRAEVIGREGAGREFAATCRVLADAIGAEVEVFEDSTHYPQIEESERFNAFLRNLWRSVR